MKGKAKIITVLAVLLVAVGVIGYWLLIQSGEAHCDFCKRPIRPEARASAEIDGKHHETCCVRCALTEGRQTDGHAHVLSVTDYTSRKAIEPESAWYVEGSREIACDHDAHLHMDETKHGSERHFDRCSPGTFAFASAEDAQKFVAEKGGVVRRWEELGKEVRP